MTSIKVAMVGCGYWGKNLARNFAALDVLAVVCDPDPETARVHGEAYRVPVNSFDQILADTSIHGVILATPAPTHAEMALRALLAGKHVFVEKPMALKVSDAESLCALAEKTNKVFMVGHLLQYHPAYIRLKELVEQGLIGSVRHIYSNRLSMGKLRTAENVFWSFAPHDVSMVLGLTGQLPDSVHAEQTAFITTGIADTSIAHMNFPSGARAHIHTSWVNPYKEQKLVVTGDKGILVFDDTKDFSEKLQHYGYHIDSKNGVPEIVKGDMSNIPLESAEPLAEECKHFLECIAHQRQPRTNAEEGLSVLKVLEAVQKSFDTGRQVMLEDTNHVYYAHPTAIVDEGCSIGEGTKIWHYSHILGHTTIGQDCVIGQNVMIGPYVTVGNKCKIQNNVSLYKGVILEDGVFCGPSCVFTNVNNPRSEIERKDEFRETYVERGVTIGANATIVCGSRLGSYSFVGAGAVVTKNIKPHALVVGNPARQIGWMSHAGEKLGEDLVCPREGRKYRITDAGLEEIQTSTEAA